MSVLGLLPGLELRHLQAQNPPTYYVNGANTRPTSPYTSWATAATNIQDAVNAGTSPGRLVLVTNGIHQSGMVVAAGTNRLALTNVVLRSVNGPQVTIIDGGGSMRCAYLSSNTLLSGFTLRRGRAQGVGSGGGALCAASTAVLTNCVISENEAYISGGVSGGTLYNCTLTSNLAYGLEPGTGGGAGGSLLHNCLIIDNFANIGGGASGCSMYNCTVTGNAAKEHAGGVLGGILSNCIVQSNQAPAAANWNELFFMPISFRYCCTSPLPPGDGNIDADPAFSSFATDDLRLRPDSPCIDAGVSLPDILLPDISGLPRPLDGDGDGEARPDMGAYEHNPYRFGPPLALGVSGFSFTIHGEPGKTVRVERSGNLANWQIMAILPIPASGQVFIDPLATSEQKLFYRAALAP